MIVYCRNIFLTSIPGNVYKINNLSEKNLNFMNFIQLKNDKKTNNLFYINHMFDSNNAKNFVAFLEVLYQQY